MNENYAQLCHEFCVLLRKTRFLSDLRELIYIFEPDGTRNVLAIFDGGYRKKINVTADSGIAMLADILK